MGVHRPRPTALGKGRRVLGKSIHANQEHPTPGTALYLCCPPTVCRRVRFATKGEGNPAIEREEGTIQTDFGGAGGGDSIALSPPQTLKRHTQSQPQRTAATPYATSWYLTSPGLGTYYVEVR